MTKKLNEIQIGTLIHKEEQTIKREMKKLQDVAETINTYKSKLEAEGVMFNPDLCFFLLTDDKVIIEEAKRQYKEEFTKLHGTRFRYNEGIDDKTFVDKITSILKEFRRYVPAHQYTRRIKFVDGKAVVTDEAIQKIVSDNETRLQTPMQVELYKKALMAQDALNNLLDYSIKHGVNYCPLVSYGGLPALLTIFGTGVDIHHMMINKALSTPESQSYLCSHDSTYNPLLKDK